MASTKIELTRESPRIPPMKNSAAKPMRTSLPVSSVLFSAMMVGISLHPSPVNNLKTVKSDTPGSPNKSGAILPNNVDDKMEK